MLRDLQNKSIVLDISYCFLKGQQRDEVTLAYKSKYVKYHFIYNNDKGDILTTSFFQLSGKIHLCTLLWLGHFSRFHEKETHANRLFREKFVNGFMNNLYTQVSTRITGVQCMEQ